MERDLFFRDVFESLQDGACLIGIDHRISHWNRRAEELSGYSSDEVVGRTCDDAILSYFWRDAAAEKKTECPLCDALADGKPREATAYLARKDGLRVPVSIRVAPVRDASGEIRGAVQVFSRNSDLIEAQSRIAELEEMAAIDSLTRLPSRRCVEQELAGRMEELTRFGRTFGVISVSVDRMKEIRKMFGAEAANDVLRMVANTLLYNCRPFDIVGRWSGTQFVGTIVGVEQTGLSCAAERLRRFVAKSVLPIGDEYLRVTVSVGAVMARWGDDVATVIERAQRMMRASRRSGRDRVTMWE